MLAISCISSWIFCKIQSFIRVQSEILNFGLFYCDNFLGNLVDSLPASDNQTTTTTIKSVRHPDYVRVLKRTQNETTDGAETTTK